MMRSEKGQATVELALSMTVIALLLFGMVDFGRILYANTVLTFAGREAARAASLGGSDAAVRDAALRAATALETSRVAVAVSPAASERRRGNYATVEVTYTLDVITPLMAEIIPNPYTVRTRTAMRIE